MKTMLVLSVLLLNFATVCYGTGTASESLNLRGDKLETAQPPRTYKQCAGKEYSGRTDCDAGWTCVRSDDWYSQCRPAAMMAAYSCSTAKFHLYAEHTCSTDFCDGDSFSMDQLEPYSDALYAQTKGIPGHEEVVTILTSVDRFSWWTIYATLEGGFAAAEIQREVDAEFFGPGGFTGAGVLTPVLMFSEVCLYYTRTDACWETDLTGGYKMSRTYDIKDYMTAGTIEGIKNAVEEPNNGLVNRYATLPGFISFAMTRPYDNHDLMVFWTVFKDEASRSAADLIEAIWLLELQGTIIQIIPTAPTGGESGVISVDRMA